MTTAFVLSGGASLGSAHVGMLQALAAHGVKPDLLVGTSVGAVNAAWVAGRQDDASLEELADVWRGLRRSTIFPTRPLSGLAGLLGRSNHLVPSSGLRAVLTKHLRFERLEDAAVPVHVIVTDLLTGQDRALSKGSAVDAVAASAAIPGIFPPVRIDGRDYVDGGVVNNTPVSHAVALGATRIYVLPTGFSCALRSAPSSALALGLHALALTVNQRLALDVERYRTEVDLRVAPPLCPLDVLPADFSQADRLMGLARTLTEAWLAGDPDVPELQGPHEHRAPNLRA